MKKNLVAFLTVLTASVFPACSGGASAAGVYMLDKAALKEAMPAEAKKDKAAMDAIDSMNMTIELKADGTASMSMKMDSPKIDETATGTWKLDGAKLTIKTKDKAGKEETKTVDYANGSFSGDFGQAGSKMTFKRK